MENWDPSANDEEDNGSPQAEMGVDGDHLNPIEPDKERNYEVDEEHCGDSGDDDSDDEDNSGDVAMVPMADTLNARFGCNSVRYPTSVFTHLTYGL